MAAKVLQIAAAQMKFRRTARENVEVIRAVVAEAAQVGCDAVLFPECAVTGYNVDFRRLVPGEVEADLKAVAEAARTHGCHVLVGSPTFAGGGWRNSLVVFDRAGRRKFVYDKIHLTPRDAEFFAPGNSIAFFRLDGVACTAILCHERRFPELVRLPVMMGAQVVFHPNAGLDALAVSKTKRGGRDGMAGRAFENQIFYVFANSVGPQGGGLWSAGDSKIVAPSMEVLALANNRDEAMVHTRIDLAQAGRKYAREALAEPAFLRAHWKAMLSACRRQIAAGRKERR